MTTTPNVTALAMRQAARSPQGQETLDRMIDSTPAEALRLIRSTTPDTARALLWAAVTGTMRQYRCPAPLPADPDDRDREAEDRMRETVARILIEHPGALGPVTLALDDAVRALAPRRR